MSKSTRLVVILLFGVTLVLTVVAIVVSNRLSTQNQVTPDQAEAGQAGTGGAHCSLNFNTGCITVNSVPNPNGNTLVRRYKCNGPFSDWAGTGCNQSGTTLDALIGSAIVGKTYCLTGSYNNQCTTEQLDIDLQDGGAPECFLSLGADANQAQCQGVTPTATQPPTDLDCGDRCWYEDTGELDCGDLSCAPGVPPETRVCWGARCGGGSTSTPTPTNTPTPTITPTTVIQPSPVNVSGKVVCQDPGGLEYPVVGAQVYIHDSTVSSCSSPPCSWTVTTDSTGKFSQSVPFKFNGGTYTNGVDVRVQSVPSGTLSTGQSYSLMKPSTTTPVTGGTFAVNCSNISATGCQADPNICQNKSFNNTSGSYAACELTQNQNITNLNFKFTNCINGPVTVTQTPTPTIPPTCGDGDCDSGETCDGNAQCSGGGVFTAGECRSSCTYCGDGIKQADEACDDGNTNNTDTCDNSCKVVSVTPYCGDGIIQPGEECEASIPNSCGPGGTCNAFSCTCSPALPGLCGSACSVDSQCPSDNVCYGGTCRLAVCVPGTTTVLSSPISATVGSSVICTSNGCDVVTCGEPCGAGSTCPTGLACNSNNICVVPYCVGRSCSNVCQLPPTALSGRDLQIYLLALVLILVGLIAYRSQFGYKTLEMFEAFGGTTVGSKLYNSNIAKSISDATKLFQSKFNVNHYKKNTRKNFESKFKKKKK